ncbi:MAG: TIGR00282 family metallophosphoesterase [Candidatus Desulfofervidaceae bacterium]|nr:TIGR00282 family metallophosphoesterase [Candidatus Desulfofervidaceae bacterium]
MPNSEVNLLFIGDIVGKPGRRTVYKLLPTLHEKYRLDCVIANGENAAGGLGITPKIADELFKNGIDVITSGNHVWHKKEIIPYLDTTDRLLRPANYPSGVPGKGYTVFSLNSGLKLGVLNLEGRVFMKNLDCPFCKAEVVLKELKQITPIVVVDFHAEATSEKIAMGWFLDGKVSAVLGTHTHVQTSDETILPQGTAYITDVGMTGPVYSIIGMEKEAALNGFLTQLPQRFKPAKGPTSLQGVVVTINSLSGKAVRITRIREVTNGN